MPSQDLISFDEIAATLHRFAGPSSPLAPSTRNRHSVGRLAFVGAVAALALAGTTYAAGLNPFGGIGAADHQQGSNDVLDPALSEMVMAVNSQFGRTVNGTLEPDTARRLDELASGVRIYAIATTTGELCVLVQEHPGSSEDTGIACGDPLNQSQPTTEQTMQPDPSLPPLSVGVARDGVVAVSFINSAGLVTAPVSHNIWSYEGPSPTSALTVHYADGSTDTIGGS